MNSRALEKAFRRVCAAAKRRKLPDLEESTSYGTPALKVRNKLVIRIKDEDTVVIMCPIEEKEILMAGAPDIYFETAHYSGWPAVLARLSQLKNEELQHRLEKAWRYRAPKRVVARFDRQGDPK
jgi:hypothetical protein